MIPSSSSTSRPDRTERATSRARSPRLWRTATAAVGLMAGSLIVPLGTLGTAPSGQPAHAQRATAAPGGHRPTRAARAAPRPTRGVARPGLRAARRSAVAGDRLTRPLGAGQAPSASPADRVAAGRGTGTAGRTTRSTPQENDEAPVVHDAEYRASVQLADAGLAVLRLAGNAERANRSRAARRSPDRDAPADPGLTAARDRLTALAHAAVTSPGCGRLPRAAADAAGLTAPVTTPHSGWAPPVTGYRLSAPYGGTGGHWASTHTGQDFAVPVGTPVRTVGAGTVERVDCGDAFGISMVVKHGPGRYTHYAHLSAVVAAPGSRVRPGALIALSGDTGNSTGPHLHFEARRTPDFGSEVDPVAWLAARGVRVG
ncbi:peptidoglycan DD-metalloendopeptidase family protein [Streptomyces sp. NPDC059740]|uniref:peptidoglycan DD-metalloendopeptidase family protein n=1 Tax=Streptomyces sp. NPDC059740 TaxID=3346926 RepID=UPI0036692D36